MAATSPCLPLEVSLAKPERRSFRFFALAISLRNQFLIWNTLSSIPLERTFSLRSQNVAARSPVIAKLSTSSDSPPTCSFERRTLRSRNWPLRLRNQSGRSPWHMQLHCASTRCTHLRISAILSDPCRRNSWLN